MVEFKNVSIVIPAYNEAETIAEVVGRARALSPDLEVVVSSDGSTDDTARLAREAGAVVVEHTYNLGNGAAVKTGARKASRPYIVFMDGDLQHRPEDIPKLLAHMPEHDMVVAARTRSSATAKHRNFGNMVLKWVAQILSGKRIDDLTSGFRAVKRKLFFQFDHLYPNAYSYPTTITLAFMETGYFVKYVPMDSIVQRSQGTSNIKPLRDGLRFINIILRIVMTFSPLKIFLPIAAATLGLGLASAIIQLIINNSIRSASILLLLSGVLLFLNGLLAEQISQIRLAQGFKREAPGTPEEE